MPHMSPITWIFVYLLVLFIMTAAFIKNTFKDPYL